MALGGRTVEEWQLKMPEDEFRRWLLYRQKYGLSLMRSVEFGAAITAQSIRGGAFADYLPQRGPKPEVAPISAEQAMALMPGTVVRR